MSKKTKTLEATRREFLDYLIPTYIVCCQDVIVGQDNTVSLLRMIDSHGWCSFPTPPVPRIHVIAEMRRNKQISIEEFEKANIQYSIKLVNPNGEEIAITSYAPPPTDPGNPWNSNRVIHDISGRLSFKMPGLYKFKLTGKVDSSEEQDLLEMLLPVIKLPDFAGTYDAEFSTKIGQGKGTVTLKNGVLTGSDSESTFSGVYVVFGGKFAAQVNVQRIGREGSLFIGEQNNYMLVLEGKVDADRHSIILNGVLSNDPQQQKIEVVLQQTKESAPADAGCIDEKDPAKSAAKKRHEASK